MVARIGALLRAVAAHEPGGATTSALGRQTGIARASAHRLLTSLAAEGLTDRDPESGRWLLGPELFLLGTGATARYDVTAIAQPIVRNLSLATEESAFYSTRRGDETICLVREDGSFPLRSHVLYEGVRFPLGVASAGLAILAFLRDDEIENYLARANLVDTYGEHHAPDAVRDHLLRTRRLGYAVNPAMIVEGSWGMAAAVFDPAGHPVGALSLTGVAHRFATQRQPELGRLLRHAAHDLSQQLTSRPNL